MAMKHRTRQRFTLHKWSAAGIMVALSLAACIKVHLNKETEAAEADLAGAILLGEHSAMSTSPA